MALFGDLEHHALTDLARVLKSQTGSLFFHQAYQGRTVELTLMQGWLRALYLDGFPVQEPARVREVLGELRIQRQGAFEFQRQEFGAGTAILYALPLLDLLQEFTEAFIPRDQLPHPDTRFVALDPAPGVPPSLEAAWAALGPHLASGTSASELAGRVGQAEQDVLVMLHRLRAVDLIAPLRAAAQLPATSPQVAQLQSGTPAPTAPYAASEAAAPSQPLVRRLLGALRRLTGKARA